VVVVFVGTGGSLQAVFYVLLALLLKTSFVWDLFIRAYDKEFKGLTGFSSAVQQTIGPNEPLWFYTPVSYSSEFDEYSQVYFYLNRHVPLAPCAEQPEFDRCQPGYYLLRDTAWEKFRSLPHVRLVLDSKESAGPAPEIRLVMVHLGE
jgi:hypothetical protein